MQPLESRHETAQTLVEFGLLLALVAVVAISGLVLFGDTISSMMSTLSHTVAFNIGPA